MSHHSLPAGYCSLWKVLRAGVYLPAVLLLLLLLEQILAVEHHGAGFTDILLLTMEQVLSVMMLVLMHGLMGWERVAMRELGTRGPVH